MGPYAFCLALGVTGLAAMALLGFSHGSHHGGQHGGHSGHGPLGHGGHGGHAGHGAAHHGHEVGQGHGHAGDSLGRVFALLSPRVLFSVLVGFGATGLLVRPYLIAPLTLAAAVLGGLAFERLLVRPIWNLLFRFESRQAITLESAILEEARAVADFDARGQGLIQLELDGQILQLLGTLTADERAAGLRVRSGALLRIEDVDAVRNRCTVSFAGERPPRELP